MLEVKPYVENASHSTAILIKDSAMDKNKIKEYYITPSSLDESEFVLMNLKYGDNGKATAKMAKEYLKGLLAAAEHLDIKTLFVCDAHYFKILTKVRKTEGHAGYVLPCAIENYEYMKVILCPNYQGLFYNPNNIDYIDLAISTLNSHLRGVSLEIGSNIIEFASYPNTIMGVTSAIEHLHQFPEISCDIETHSLKFYETDIATIAFAWDKHEGVAFRVNMDNTKESVFLIKAQLKEFFETYKGSIVYHNANFDIKIIIANLFMDSLNDQKGLIEGIRVMTKNIHDTKIITYLATNSTAGNKLGLKHQAHEFTGNYGVDVTDINKVPVADLLEYNLKDCLATLYVKEKHFPVLKKESQLGIYEDILMLSIPVILQMELTGMPMDMDKVTILESGLSKGAKICTNFIQDSPIIKRHTIDLRKEEYVNQNLLWKRKKEPLEYFDYVTFNPASNQQLSELLYNRLNLPILDLTKSKQPAVGAKTLKKLMFKTEEENILSLLDNLVKLSEIKKILDTFISAFRNNTRQKNDGTYYLFGNFNIGGTVSGRLSSSSPNLQNIPSNSTYGKKIKECFIAPDGWLMAGADFDSLEDRISALTTKDPNKLKVYEENYDGHCLRAYSYFGAQMPDIGNTVSEINSIATRYPVLRQNSKAPTFLLTYGGTFHGLMNNVGLDKESAQAIELNYHELYKVSDDWVADKINKASSDGYITCAFGLRVRTPILKQTVLGAKSTPFEASSEARTAGNALGQSYGLLNNRASIEFQKRVLNSPYAHSIKPIAQIHDAMYFIIENNLGCVKWFNDNLTDCMAWQELPELKHDKVKLSGGVDIFYPNWSNSIGLSKNASKKEIIELCAK